MSFKIRQANAQDCDAICKLHVASIQHYCSSFYPEASVAAWAASKTSETYISIPDRRICIVAEVDKNIIGFGLLNLAKKSIDSLYLAPDFSGKGYGKALLSKLEKIALEHSINELTLSVTLNAVGFYHTMSYVGEEKSICRLSAEVQLDCVVMVKKLIFDNKMIEKTIRDLEKKLLDPEFRRFYLICFEKLMGIHLNRKLILNGSLIATLCCLPRSSIISLGI